ncbi:MAG: AAC(3) family N-acetyltransferase [Flavobacteriales bacterium]
MSVLPPLADWPAMLGVAPGSVWMVQADLTRIVWAMRRARLQAGPDELLNAFVEAVGPAGSLLVPTFNHDLHDGESFDVRRTPTITGALGEAARRHPAFERTAHPLHSVAVAGAGARELAASTERSSFGPSSPFAFMHRHSARILALDIDVTYALTYIHHVEELERVAYRQWRNVAIDHTAADGTRAWTAYRLYAKRPGHMNSTARLEAALLEQGSLQQGSLGPLRYTTVDVPALHQLLVDDIRATGGALIHDFSWERWLRDRLRAILRREGPSRSHMALNEHAARTPR